MSTKPKKSRPKCQYKRRMNEVTEDLKAEADIAKHRMIIREMRKQKTSAEDVRNIAEEVKKVQQKIYDLNNVQNERREKWEDQQRIIGARMKDAKYPEDGDMFKMALTI